MGRKKTQKGQRRLRISEAEIFDIIFQQKDNLFLQYLSNIKAHFNCTQMH